MEVEITVCTKPPSPRVNFTFAAHPAADELILFGGEYYNGQNQYVYGDLFTFNLKKAEWKKITSPNSPPPRCGHASAVRARGGGELYVFGGEYSSRNQEKFKHYNDLWVYYFKEQKWEKLTATNGPTPRSGHRMVIAGNSLVVFGGYFDNGKSTPKYMDDVHVYDLETRVWMQTTITKQVISPSARSAFQMIATGEDRILVMGGYRREKVKGIAEEQGMQLADMWELLRIETSATDISSVVRPTCTWRWLKLKATGSVPGTRTGVNCVMRDNSNQAYSFGGVTDQETEWAVSGSFMNELLLLNTEENKFHEVSVKKGMDCKDKQEEIEQDRRERIKAKIAAAKAKKIAAKKKGSASARPNADDDCPQVVRVDADDVEIIAADGVWPRPRSSTGLAIKGRILYLYGGYNEVGDRMITLSDLYSLDIGKMDEWIKVEDTSEESKKWLGEESDSESDSEYTDEDGDEE
ncbi:hypothetical protein SARC_06173 [Sphaeroforma arctica JP610]|uniref:DUF4110 domain-containing protein n=1 Tax=Sphaeroforma arctica JP610 TaxID=667725 RepID=A0A0L0FXE9_9EUKA|nr:hypothetical protein SARC_06173 [Sphaeroforma arctica JP610]KNC81507.1 hypothetical protein SARC_06173 [Sphaeroforma arctica JP610]|eukprot:XP_014155409.1 hypothetical protein SARC_06173 [Sphaeroforma arctica JP610]